ncbi:MAG TPA: hydroxyacid dehydrogenase [Nitrososphaerales archaeon]|nr:hydroxyacid dehydrogenase [Nitrososphaerales archaeon]
MKILLAEPLVDSVDGKALKELRQLGEVKVSASSSEAILSAEISDADVLITRGAPVTKKIIQSARVLKVIGQTGTGTDNIDVPAASERGILVVNAPELNSVSVAEHTFSLILALEKNLQRFDSELRAGNPGIRDVLLRENNEIAGKTIGIIGFGAIGSEVARLAKAFGMKIIGFDPYISKERFEAASIRRSNLETLLEASDIVTLHVPLGSETRHLIGSRELALMKEGSFLINCSRGGVVDESALAQALDSRHIAGAGIDVFEKEFDPSNPLFKNPHAIVTPHVAGHTREARVRIMGSLVADIKLALGGGTPKNLVNRDALSVGKHSC